MRTKNFYKIIHIKCQALVVLVHYSRGAIAFRIYMKNMVEQAKKKRIQETRRRCRYNNHK